MSNNKIKKGSETWGLGQFFARFPDDEAARLYIERRRWSGEPLCPHCGGVRTTTRKHKSMPYRCKDCRKEFSVRTGTVFANANATYQQILLAFHLLSVAKKSISAPQLAKGVGCSQKTARYLEHRIRKSMLQKIEPLTGKIKIDETPLDETPTPPHENARQALAYAELIR